MELLVVGAEEHGHIPYGSLKQVVDTHAKASANVGHIAIVIDARQQAEAVDDKSVRMIRNILISRSIQRSISYDLTALKKFLNLLQMILADDMRGDDQLPFWMLVEILNEDLLVRRPRRTGDKHFRTLLTNKLFHDGQLLCGLLNLEHTVEARVANHRHTVDAYASQQLLALFVLHEEVREAVQHPSVLTTVPLEEHLIRTEDARHAIHRHTSMLEDMEIVVPELILDEERLHRMYQSEETSSVGNGVERQVADDVSPLVILPDLIARG